MKKEKRSYPRVKVSWPVSMITSAGAMEGETKDVSTSGAFILCQQPLEPAENLLLTVKLPAGSPFKVNAKVVWSNFSNLEDTTSPKGIGVRFLW